MNLIAPQTDESQAATPELTLESIRASAYESCCNNRIPAGESELRKGLAIWNEHPELLTDMAALLHSQGRLVESENFARRALVREDSHVVARYWLAANLAATRRNEEAIEQFLMLTTPDACAALSGVSTELSAQAVSELARLKSLVAEQRPIASTLSSTRWTGRGAAKYELDHLNQAANQDVGGPVQDDEALMLYATVRASRLRRILEVGGLNGYSARNFLAALGDDPGAALYTVDINPVPSLSEIHHVITKDCAEVRGPDLHFVALDMVFLDAHVYEPQMKLLAFLEERGYLQSHTILALHDTNLHAVKRPDWAYRIEDTDGSVGFVHQVVERRMVNDLHAMGWDSISFHVEPGRCDRLLPTRHGLTLMKRFRELRV